MELSTLDVKIEEEDKVLLLLVSLPLSHDHIVTILLFGKDTLRHDEVIAPLLLDESRRKSSNDSLSGEGSTLVTTHGRDRSIRRQAGSNEHK